MVSIYHECVYLDENMKSNFEPELSANLTGIKSIY